LGLKSINYSGADELLKAAEQMKQEIIRAYQWSQSRSPAQRLPNGSWTQPYPTSVYTHGVTEGNFVYDIELGAHQLVPQGILDPCWPEVTAMINHMEDVAFLRSGTGDYPSEKNNADWFNLGGFSKFQPYYTRIAHIYAMRDEVKPFIRSYFNTIPSLLSMENLCFWEVFNNGCAWNKTHETGYFLQQSRMMLVFERGDQLWLGPFVTNHWMKAGMVVAVHNAPTKFGKVSYKITSAIDKGYIEAVIEPPSREMPKWLVIRLRHPEQRQMKSVTINGKNYYDFNPEREYIRLKPTAGEIVLRAEY